MRLTLSLPFVALALVGCGDHSLPPGGEEDMAVNSDMSIGDMSMITDDSRHYVTFEMFAQDYAQAVCTHYMGCGQLDTAQMNACLERYLRHSGWDQDVEIMKGRMQINEAQCINAINNARCDNSDTKEWTSKCLELLYLPNVANGGACLSGFECTSGFCQHAGSDAGTAEQVTGCPGTCADPKPVGLTCRLLTDCTSDAACEGFPTGTCVQLAALNEACESVYAPMPDYTKQPCQNGLMCPTFPSTPPATCVVPSTQTALHGACDPYQGGAAPLPACGTGLYCQVQYTAGSACTGAPGDCSSVQGAYCDTVAGMCQNPSAGKCEMKLASGAQCDPHNEGVFSFVDSQCVDGTLCTQVGAQTMPTCQAFGGSGADCLNLQGTTTCKVGFTCNGSNKCTPWIGDGQSCGAAGTACNASIPLQATCIADNADAGTAMTCEAAKSFGTSCLPGYEDSLCAPSDNSGSAFCEPSGSGGNCAPKCY